MPLTLLYRGTVAGLDEVSGSSILNHGSNPFPQNISKYFHYTFRNHVLLFFIASSHHSLAQQKISGFLDDWGHGGMENFYMGVSMAMGVLQNAWFIMENPTKVDDDRRYPYDSGNHQKKSLNLIPMDYPNHIYIYPKIFIIRNLIIIIIPIISYYPNHNKPHPDMSRDGLGPRHYRTRAAARVRQPVS